MGAESEQLKSALSLAARGFRVFRLRPGAKEPAFKGWQAEATSDPETIKGLWGERDYNIGVATGQGLIGIDIDVKNGKDGEASFSALGIPEDYLDTFIVRTPSGGRHVYFRSDRDVPNSAGSLGPGLDIRGDGGYLVGPGSSLTNGSGVGSYLVDHDASVHDYWGGLHRKRDSHDNRNDPPYPMLDLDDPGAVIRARSWLQDTAPLAVEHRGGDHTTFTVAARLKDFGVGETTAFELMFDHWNPRCSPPWEFHDLQTKVRNTFLYGENPPGSDHPAAHFSDVEIVPAPSPPSLWLRHGQPFDPNSVDWNFFQLAPRRGVGVLSGPSQGGKTFLEVEWARCQATGKLFFGVKPDALGAVIFLFAGSEGSGFEQRLAALGEPGALPISATSVRNLGERGALGELYKLIKAEADAMMLWHGVPLRLIFLETLSASGLLVDENSNTEVARAFSNLAQLAEMLDVLIITTHHPPKDGKGQRGAGAIFDNVDYVWEIHREGREAVRRLDLSKARGAEQRTIGSFSLVQTVLGHDKLGRAVTSMTVSMGDAPAPSRTPPKMEAFNRSLEFAALEGGLVEGVKQPLYLEALAEFKTLVEDDIKDRSNVNRAFRKCLDFAMALGVVEDRLVNGTRYLIRKEIIA